MNEPMRLLVNGLHYRVSRWMIPPRAISRLMEGGSPPGDMSQIRDAVRAEVAAIRKPITPLLFLHGFSGAGQNWSGLIERLPPGAAFAPDLIGHGETDAPTDPARYSMEAAAADLFALWGQLGMPPVQLVGYSMGGRLALYTALTYPAMVAGLTLQSASPGLATEAERAERRAADETLAARIEREGIAWFADMWEQLPLFAHQSTAVRAALRVVRLAQRPAGLANSLRGMGTGAQPNLWDRLQELNVPVDLIVGSLDAKFVAINQAMAARIPACQLHIIDGAGHSVHQEQPAAVAALLRMA